ncbi:MAG: response regulator [Spirochaetota bacterium]|nr:response regulator [Spirochaetota bacterium]
MRDEKPLIMLVDDNPTNLRIGKNVISEKYNTATAPSAEKLFKLLEVMTPDMILLDVDMPEMDGYETIRILKSKQSTQNIPVMFLTAKTESEDELMGLSLGAVDYITKPFQPVLLLKRIEIHLLIQAQRLSLEAQASELRNFNENLQSMVEEKTKDIMTLQNIFLTSLAEVVEARDDTTGQHIERTQLGVGVLLDEIIKRGLWPNETRDWNKELVLQSCQLHDLGKVGVSDAILKKPGKLTTDEFDEMKKHTILGKQMIEKAQSMTNVSDFLEYAKIFVSFHHEYWDGSGYPYGLKGEEIPLLGRIMAIADVYDALVSVRPYKPAYPHQKAVQIIRERRGTQFDPTLVDIFLESADCFRFKKDVA